MLLIHTQQESKDGGCVTVTRNGVTTTISKAGECITHLNDSYSTIQFSQPGSMVVMQCTLMRDRLGHKTHPITPPVILNSALLHSLMAVLRGSLTTYKCVVLPLVRYYNIIGADLDNWCLETDSDAFNDQDTALLQFLSVYFDVTVVTICYYRLQDQCCSCVFNATTCHVDNQTTTTTPSIGMSGALIIPLPNGYGVGAAVNSCVRKEGDQTITIVTGLRIVAK